MSVFETERVRIEPHDSIMRVYTVFDKTRPKRVLGTVCWHKHWDEICFYQVTTNRLVPLSAFRDIADFMDKLANGKVGDV